MHPADELHAVREEIRALRRREEALRRHFTAGAGVADRRGRRWAVQLSEQRSHQLDPATLPRQVLGDGRFWREKVTLRVCLTALAPSPAAPAMPPPPAAAAPPARPQLQARRPQPQAEARRPERHAEATPFIDWEDSTA